MAIHELYLGGGRTTNTNSAMFPAPTFTQDGTVRPTSHKGNVMFSLSRTFDFRDDRALVHYVKNNTLTAGDYLGAVLIPDKTLLVGVYIEVERAVTGVTLLARLRDDASTLIATFDGGTVASGYYGAGGAALASGTPGNMVGVYLNDADILDIELDALPVDGVQDLRFTVSPVVIDFKRGQW